MLDDPDPDTRQLAAREIGETAYTPAIARLEKLLTSSDLAERATAGAAIVRILSAKTSWRSHILADRPLAPPPQATPAAPPTAPPAPPRPASKRP
jgi:hypothetical protein